MKLADELLVAAIICIKFIFAPIGRLIKGLISGAKDNTPTEQN